MLLRSYRILYLIRSNHINASLTSLQHAALLQREDRVMYARKCTLQIINNLVAYLQGHGVVQQTLQLLGVLRL